MHIILHTVMVYNYVYLVGALTASAVCVYVYYI